VSSCFENAGIGAIGIARGGQRSHAPKFLESIVILCFESRFSKQNSVIRLKSNIFAPAKFFGPPNFWDGYAIDRSFTSVFSELFHNGPSTQKAKQSQIGKI